MPEVGNKELRDFAARWRRVGPLLEEQREDDVRRSDTASNVAAFSRLWSETVKKEPPLPTSGLIEQQRIFMKLAGS